MEIHIRVPHHEEWIEVTLQELFEFGAKQQFRFLVLTEGEKLVLEGYSLMLGQTIDVVVGEHVRVYQDKIIRFLKVILD